MRHRWISTWATIASVVVALLSYQGWGVAMAVLEAWLVKSGSYEWAAALGAGIAVWALVGVGQFYRNKALTLTPDTPEKSTSPIVIPPQYAADEIKDKLLPALTKMDGILLRRCGHAVATVEGLRSRYWEELGTLSQLRGAEASKVASELRESRELIEKGHMELGETVAGPYERELAPLVDVPGSILREACRALTVVANRVAELSKPEADKVDRLVILAGDGHALRQVTMEYGYWQKEARLLVGNRNLALREMVQNQLTAQ